MDKKLDLLPHERFVQYEESDRDWLEGLGVISSIEKQLGDLLSVSLNRAFWSGGGKGDNMNETTRNFARGLIK